MDKVAAELQGVDLSKALEFPNRDDSSEGKSLTEVDSTSKDESSGGEDGGTGKEQEEGNGENGKKFEIEDDAKGKGKEEKTEAKPSKIQILVWRSEGMGEYMANELGPNFKIPKGFY